MTTIDTVVIGAGHAGLAVSQLLTGRGPRPRRPRPRPGRRALAHRALGLAAPAHPELDDPAPRLELRRPRPGRLPQRRRSSSATSSAYAASFDAPVAGGSDGARGRALRRRPEALPGRHRPRHLARPARRHRDRAARDARTSRPAWPASTRASTWSPRTTTATPASCRTGGVLVVGASASGRADRRRARPGRPRGRARGRAAHPDARAATAAWTSSGGWRTPVGWPAPSTTCPTRRRRARRPSLQLVGRDDPARRHRRTSTSAACRRAASGWPGG